MMMVRSLLAYLPCVVVEPSHSSAVPARAVMAVGYASPLLHETLVGRTEEKAQNEDQNAEMQFHHGFSGMLGGVVIEG